MPPAAHPLDDYHLMVSLESHLHIFAVWYQIYEMIRKKNSTNVLHTFS